MPAQIAVAKRTEIAPVLTQVRHIHDFGPAGRVILVAHMGEERPHAEGEINQRVVAQHLFAQHRHLVAHPDFAQFAERGIAERRQIDAVEFHREPFAEQCRLHRREPPHLH